MLCETMAAAAIQMEPLREGRESDDASPSPGEMLSTKEKAQLSKLRVALENGSNKDIERIKAFVEERGMEETLKIKYEFKIRQVGTLVVNPLQLAVLNRQHRVSMGVIFAVYEIIFL